MKSTLSAMQTALPARLALLAVLLCAWLMPPAHAQQSLFPTPVAPQQRVLAAPAEEEAQVEAPQGRATISQKRALELARARFSGNVISINQVRERDGTMRYRIRMDNGGNIFTVFVDSRTGAVSRN